MEHNIVIKTVHSRHPTGILLVCRGRIVDMSCLNLFSFDFVLIAVFEKKHIRCSCMMYAHPTGAEIIVQQCILE